MDIGQKNEEKLSIHIVREIQTDKITIEKTDAPKMKKHILTCNECKKNTSTWCGDNPPNNFMCCMCQLTLLNS